MKKVAVFVVFIWIIELINLSVGHRLNAWGILPRTINGLIGIPISPFLHGSINHVALNTVPLAVLGTLVMFKGTRIFIESSVFIIIVGGLLTWLLGREAFHVGASGLIFGYFGFLVAYGWYEKSLSSITISLVTLFLYGGILWGVLPTQKSISFEGHFFGLLAGIAAARIRRPVG